MINDSDPDGGTRIPGRSRFAATGPFLFVPTTQPDSTISNTRGAL